MVAKIYGAATNKDLVIINAEENKTEYTAELEVTEENVDDMWQSWGAVAFQVQCGHLAPIEVVSLTAEKKNGDQNPGDGDQNPGDGDQNPGDGDNEPGDGDNDPGDGDNEPGDGDNEPGDGDNEPGDGDNDPEETTADPEETTGDDAVAGTGEGTGTPTGTGANPSTGVALAIVPAVIAAAGVIVAKKRK